MLGAGGAYLSAARVAARVGSPAQFLRTRPSWCSTRPRRLPIPENEALIQRAFSKLAAGRTVIMIAHRLSTVVWANKIVVLNQGSVQEAGTHAELLSQNGLYAKIWPNTNRPRAGKSLLRPRMPPSRREARPMFASFQKKYFLSDKGVAGMEASIRPPILTMAGIGFLFLVMAGFVEHLATGADLPDALPIVGGLLVFLVLLSPLTGSSITTACSFSAASGVLEIAERLRKLPLSFGHRDLAHPRPLWATSRPWSTPTATCWESFGVPYRKRHCSSHRCSFAGSWRSRRFGACPWPLPCCI